MSDLTTRLEAHSQRRVGARFFVTSVKQTTNAWEVDLQAATRGARNRDWAEATPNGKMSLYIQNEDAARVFIEALDLQRLSGLRQDAPVGLPIFYPEFDITFTPAPQAGDGHPFVETPKGHYVHPNCADCGQPEEGH